MPKQSQTQQIRAHLEQHGSITPLEALTKFGCFRLGARIWDLRHELNIHTEPMTRAGKTFARYVLVRQGQLL